MKITAAMLFGVLQLATFGAVAAGSHEHGTGSLNAAIERAKITIVLALPLDVLVGYERAPRTEKERAALLAAQAQLRESGLFMPASEAGCVLKSATINVPFTGPLAPRGPSSPGSATMPGGQAVSDGEHADVDAEYVFDCVNAAAGAFVDTTIFKRFPRLYRLDVQRIGLQGQARARLTPKSPALRW